jgi:hypothetical protein
MDVGMKITILNTMNEAGELRTLQIDVPTHGTSVLIEDNSDGTVHDLVAPLLDWWYKYNE